MFSVFTVWALGTLSAILGLALSIHPPTTGTGKRRYWYGSIGAALLGLGAAIGDKAEQASTEMWKDAELAATKRAEARWRKENEDHQKRTELKLTTVAAQVDPKSQEELLAISRKLVVDLVNVTTGPAVSEFYNTLPSQQQVRASMLEADKRILAQYTLRFRPISDLVLTSFDKWIAGAKERQMWVSEESHPEMPIAEIGANRGNWVRAVQLAPNLWVRVMANSGMIENQKLVNEFGLTIYINQPKGNHSLWAVSLGEKRNFIYNQMPNRFPFKNYEGASEMPLSDPEFIKQLNISINQVMSYILLEASEDSKNAVQTASAK